MGATIGWSPLMLYTMAIIPTYDKVVIDATCNTVLLNINLGDSGITGGVSATISASGNGSQTTSSVAVTAGIVNTSIPFASDGIVTVQLSWNGGANTYTAYGVSTCAVDCCIAKLVDSAIKCTCKCDKCKEELDRAEKVFLLLQAAAHSATVGNRQLAEQQYKKAKDLCVEVCACGC